jgi:hypothetical protein
MKKIFLVFLLISLSIALMGCSSDELDEISLYGKEIQFIIKNQKYNELGVNIPEGYTYVIDGEVDNSQPGFHTVAYNILDASGEHVTWLNRTIFVMGYTPPSRHLSDNLLIYRGTDCDLNTFNITIEGYDDIANNNELTSNLEELLLEEDGLKTLIVSSTDATEGTILYEIDFEYITDIFHNSRILVDLDNHHSSSINFDYDKLMNYMYYYHSIGFVTIHEDGVFNLYYDHGSDFGVRIIFNYGSANEAHIYVRYDGETVFEELRFDITNTNLALENLLENLDSANIITEDDKAAITVDVGYIFSGFTDFFSDELKIPIR